MGIKEKEKEEKERRQSHHCPTTDILNPTAPSLPMMVHRLSLTSTTSLSVHTLVSKVDIIPAPPTKVRIRQCPSEVSNPSLHTRALLDVDSRLALRSLLLLAVVLRVRVVVHNFSAFADVLWRAAAVVVAVMFTLRVVGSHDTVSVLVVSSAVLSMRVVARRVLPVERSCGTR